MKVQSRKLAARLPWLRSLIITASGLCCVFGLGLIDYHTPGPMSFVLFYMVVVVLVGRHAGKWPAMFISGIAVIMLATVQWGLGRGAPQTVWVALWNNSTRFVVFSIAGWLTAELTRLTRHLSDLVAERTAQWKSEADRKRVVEGKRGEIGGRRIIKKKLAHHNRPVQDDARPAPRVHRAAKTNADY